MKKIIFFLLIFGIVLPFGFYHAAFASTATNPQTGTITVQSEDASGNPISAAWVISGPATITGSGFTETYTNESVGSYTIVLPTPPPGYSLESVSPATSQSLLGESAITFTIVWQELTSPASVPASRESGLLPFDPEIGRFLGQGIANMPSGEVLSATQGYNSQNNAYESSPNIFGGGDTYLILYGAFAQSGNSVTVNGSALPSNQVIYQSTNQINISLDSSFAGTPFTVAVAGANGTTATLAVNGASNAVSSSTDEPPTAAFLEELENASDTDSAVSIAQAAGFTVTGGVLDTEFNDADYLVTTPSGVFVAALARYDISNAVGAPDRSVMAPFEEGNSDNICRATVGNGTDDVFVWADGKIYGMASVPSYSLSVDCAANDPISCAQTTADVNAAQSALVAAGGPPAVAASNNVIHIRWVSPQELDDPTDKTTLGTTNAVFTSATTGVCKIIMATQNVGNLTTPEITKIIAHEMTHCMGISHSTDINSLMYPTLATTTLAFSSDDKSLLAALKSNADIPVANCANGTPVLPKIIAPNTTSTSNICFDLSDGSVSCACGEGYSQVGDACVTAPTCSSNPDAAGCPTFCENNPNDPSCNICTQNPDLAQCHQCASKQSWSTVSNECLANGSSTENICFDGSQCQCGTGFVQSEGTCVLESSNYYSCSSDGACTSDPNGGYSDSNCDDQCTANTNAVLNGDYACMPNWDSGGFECVQVPAGSGSYSDPSCGGGC